MKNPNEEALPHAREEGLIVQELEGEVLVYDMERHKAHCLNETAAAVWKRCDGRTTVAHMAALLETSTQSPADQRVVLLALDSLDKAHLLQEPPTRRMAAARISRRDVLRTLGLTAAAAAMVTSIVAPAAAAAASGCRVVAEDGDLTQCQGCCCTSSFLNGNMGMPSSNTVIAGNPHPGCDSRNVSCSPNPSVGLCEESGGATG